MSHQILNAEIIVVLAMWFVPLLVLITMIIFAAISILSERRKTKAEFNFEPVVAILNRFFSRKGPKD